MEKVRTSLKLLIVLASVLLSMFIFNSTNVLAVNYGDLFEGNSFVGIKIDDVILLENGEIQNTIDGVTYDKATNTLTLNNYSGDYLRIGNLGEDFKIKVVGTNNFNGMGGAASGDYGEIDGFTYLFDSIIFTGTGTLNIKDVLNVGAGGLTIDGPTINVSGPVNNVGDLTVKSGKLVIEVESGFPIDCSSFEYSDNIEFSDKDGKSLYLVKSEYGYKVFCYTETYSADSIAKSVVIKEKVIEPIKEEETSTGIKLETTTEIVPEGTKLVVEKVTEGTNYNLVVEALGEDVEKFVAYDITLTSNNAEIQPNGKVKISLPIPEGYDASKILVYRVAEDGTKIKYDTTIEDDYVVIEADHFSNYVIAQEKTQEQQPQQPSTDNTNTNKPTNNNKLDETPKTGAETNVVNIISILAIISLAGIIILKRNNK